MKMSWSVRDNFLERGAAPGCLGWIWVADEEYSRWETWGQVDHGKSESWMYQYSLWKPVCPKGCEDHRLMAYGYVWAAR